MKPGDVVMYRDREGCWVAPAIVVTPGTKDRITLAAFPPDGRAVQRFEDVPMTGFYPDEGPADRGSWWERGQDGAQ